MYDIILNLLQINYKMEKMMAALTDICNHLFDNF